MSPTKEETFVPEAPSAPVEVEEYTLRGELFLKSGKSFVIELGESFSLTNHNMSDDVNQFVVTNNRGIEERLFVNGDRIDYILVTRVKK